MRHLLIFISLVAAVAVFPGIERFANQNPKIDRFPETTVRLNYKVSQLRALAASDEIAQRYVRPLLFPLDLFALIFLGIAMAVASWFWAQSAGVLTQATWIVLVMPIGYMIADLAEDSLLAFLLTDRDAIGDGTVWALKGLTAVKFVCLGAAGVQTAGLGATAAYKAVAASM